MSATCARVRSRRGRTAAPTFRPAPFAVPRAPWGSRGPDGCCARCPAELRQPFLVHPDSIAVTLNHAEITKRGSRAGSVVDEPILRQVKRNDAVPGVRSGKRNVVVDLSGLSGGSRPEFRELIGYHR